MSAHSTNPQFASQASGYQTFHGHQKVIATKCWHEIHPGSSAHTPWCPPCATSQTRAKLDAAQRNLVAEGGLTPAEGVRNRSWNTARIRHEIAKQRLRRVRVRDQLRWEREQAWNEEHRRHDCERLQTATDSESLAKCLFCASIAIEQSAYRHGAQIANNLPWWESPGALVVEQGLMPQTPPPSRNRRHKPAHRYESSKALRQIIQSARETMLVADVCRQVWNVQHRTELAVRQKHGLGEDFQIYPGFWESPISGYISLRNHQQIQEAQRMAERKARGNTTRPRPPPSSLSYSESLEGWDVDAGWIETQCQEEEQARVERAVRKIGEEVGYLYFVGAIDGMDMWKDDFMRSNRNLIVRNQVLNSETSGSEDSKDGDDGFEDADDVEMMDIDES